MKYTKPGDLIKASRDPKQKRSVMKAIGMPMKKKAKKGTKMTPSQEMAMKKAKKGTMGFVKGNTPNESQTTRRKGSMTLVSSPKSHSKLRTKKAKKGVSGKSFGDEKLQDLKLEHTRERMSGVKKGAKRRKGTNSLIKNPKNTKMPKKIAKKAFGLA